MSWADFAEKEYEIAFAIELAAAGPGDAVVFSCSQVLEKVLGYDALADPHRNHPIWRLLGLPRPPGVRLLPPHWVGGARPRAADLPSTAVSLILQYKRPEYLYGSRAKQWSAWRGPYYRFAVYGGQQSVLARLERGLGDDALVRYAAPAFWQRGQLEAATLGRDVIAQSGFVNPLALKGHRVWTYDRPGTAGRGNPQPRRHRFQTFGELLDQLLRPAPQGSTQIESSRRLDHHLQRLGGLARDREPRLRELVDPWVGDVGRADTGLTRREIALVRDFATTVTLLGQLGASWHLVGRHP